MKSLADLQGAFKTPEREGSNLPNNYYPFWNMKEGEQAIVRFLPDGNEDNALGFLVEKVMHNLVINGDKKNVPCLSMYGEDCPICGVSQQYYKADDKDNGKKYWKKKQHLAQALIVEDPLPADEATGENSEGKVKFLALGYQLFNIIKEAFESGELDEIPYAYDGGCNFIIKKTKQGDYATYAVGSKFARKASDLDEDTVANLQLSDLETLLPKHPGREKVEGMLEAALTGGDYTDNGSSSTTTTTTTPSVTESVSKAIEASESSTESSDEDIDEEANDILAQIRARKNAKAE